MSDATLMEIAVWTEADVPVRFVYRGRRHTVTDQPTKLEPDIWWPTHPPALPVGWRVQGTDEQGLSLVFDLRHDASTGRWSVAHIWQ